MGSDEVLSRDELLAGLVAKRARTLLFLIESQTAHRVAQSRQAMERFRTEETAQERDLAFLEAFSLGQSPPLRPAIQDLERYAPQWGALVPETPRMRAALAHSLGRKYTFTRESVPNIREALDLDESAVQEAYQRLYHQPLSAIYAARVRPTDRLRWAWTALPGWLESLPAGLAQELKVWVYKVTATGDSESVPGRLNVHTAGESREFDLALAGESITLPLDNAACQVDIRLTEKST